MKARLCVVLPLIVLNACSLLKKKEEDAGTTEDTTTTTTDAAAADAGGPKLAAKNAADVVRFPSGEVPMSDLAAKTTAANVAKTGCKSGNQVATVAPNTDVVEVAAYDDCFLVTFLDPKAPTDRLAGWITKDAFGSTVTNIITTIKDAGAKDATADAAVVDAGKPALKCVAPQMSVSMGGDPVCHKKCTTDKDCGGIAGACVVASATVGGKATHVCNNQ